MASKHLDRDLQVSEHGLPFRKYPPSDLFPVVSLWKQKQGYWELNAKKRKQQVSWWPHAGVSVSLLVSVIPVGLFLSLPNVSFAIM
jgi:hypothetical protein